MDQDVFHADERRAQALAGFVLKGAPIRDSMPDQHRTFFGALPILFMAVPDAAGWPVATALVGAPGFVSSLDAVTLRIGALPADDDPAAAGLAAGAPIGLLGLEFATRRRNRANGVVSAVMREAFFVEVRQSFGNCPQYIQTRRPVTAGDGTAGDGAAGDEAVGDEAGPAETLGALDAAARAAIAAADTFFVGSRSDGQAGGFDMSHRGGRPGFVSVEDDVLVIPDYRGNRFFNTFGNLLADNRAGLLFADFATGDLLQLQGRAAISWAERREGAERVWRVRVTRATRRRGALRLRWALEALAPQLVGG